MCVCSFVRMTKKKKKNFTGGEKIQCVCVRACLCTVCAFVGVGKYRQVETTTQQLERIESEGILLKSSSCKVTRASPSYISAVHEDIVSLNNSVCSVC